MKSKNVRKNSKVDETERVKLYKTHRGWWSRFWTFLKAASVDEDDETSYEDYLKVIATIGTIAGATMLLPTTAMADSTQLQRTLDSRSSMAIGLSSNTQSESVSGSTDSSNSLDSTNSTTTETSTSKSEAAESGSNTTTAENSTTNSTSSEDSLNSAGDSNTSSESNQTTADSLSADNKTANSSSITSDVNNSASENSQAEKTPDYSQPAASQSANTLTAASIDPQAAAANYLQAVLSQLWARQSNQVTHPNTILEDECELLVRNI